MDFNAKRLALLAGVGNSEDRHDIVREYAQQLNESAEARQLNEAEEAVRKAVRRTIQKMISEGAINLREDSISRELEHLRANIKADHDHLEALLGDMHDDRDEIERAEHHREEMHEEEGYGITGGAMHIFEDEEEAERARKEKDRKDEGAYDLKESDATLRRLQALAGLQVLTEGYTDDELRELCHSKDHNCALVVEHPVWGRGKPVHGSHALPDDEGNVEWYDVQFKHGIEKKVMAEDVEVLKMGSHTSEGEMDEDEVEETHCKTMEEDEDHMEEGQAPGVTDGEMVPSGSGPNPRSTAYEGEDHDEAKLYEMEDGTHEMEMHGKRYALVPLMEEEMDEAQLKGTMDTDKKEFTPEPIPVQ